MSNEGSFPPTRGLGGGMGIEGGLTLQSVAPSGAQKQVLLINYTIKVLLLRSSVEMNNERSFPPTGGQWWNEQ